MKYLLLVKITVVADVLEDKIPSLLYRTWRKRLLCDVTFVHLSLLGIPHFTSNKFVKPCPLGVSVIKDIRTIACTNADTLILSRNVVIVLARLLDKE